MITHDQFIAVIKLDYPTLEHGVDYWVGQPVKGDRQLADARIYEWSASVPQPDQEIILQRARAIANSV